MHVYIKSFSIEVLKEVRKVLVSSIIFFVILVIIIWVGIRFYKRSEYGKLVEIITKTVDECNTIVHFEIISSQVTMTIAKKPAEVKEIKKLDKEMVTKAGEEKVIHRYPSSEIAPGDPVAVKLIFKDGTSTIAYAYNKGAPANGIFQFNQVKDQYKPESDQLIQWMAGFKIKKGDILGWVVTGPNLEKNPIESPIDGTVGLIYVLEGQKVVEGEHLFVIFSLTPPPE